MKSFVRGKAVMLGDAAHLMMPTHAAGGSIAIESAAVLEVLMGDVVARRSSFARTTGTSEPPPRPSLTSGALTLFDSLRVPRCVAFQLLSTGGFGSQGKPEIIEEIRRHGFDGPLPGAMASLWDQEFRQWYFDYDPKAEARRALAVGKTS